MVTENYVSFEVAKLLKEKGFGGVSCFSMYVTPKPRSGMGNPNEAKIAPHGRDSYYYEGYLYQCEAPTLQQAMKWLREEHKIEIRVIYDNDKLCWYGACNPMNEPSQILLGSGRKYKSYEEAADEAIKYGLENLV